MYGALESVAVLWRLRSYRDIIIIIIIIIIYINAVNPLFQLMAWGVGKNVRFVTNVDVWETVWDWPI